MYKKAKAQIVKTLCAFLFLSSRRRIENFIIKQNLPIKNSQTLVTIVKVFLKILS